jgi:hypothetical protein
MLAGPPADIAGALELAHPMPAWATSARIHPHSAGTDAVEYPPGEQVGQGALAPLQRVPTGVQHILDLQPLSGLDDMRIDLALATDGDPLAADHVMGLHHAEHRATRRIDPTLLADHSR